MTDLLAPILAVLDNEVEAFWCFTNLIHSSSNFQLKDNQISIKNQIVS